MSEKHEAQPDPQEGTPVWRVNILNDLLDEKLETKFLSSELGLIQIRTIGEGVYMVACDPCKKYPQGLALVINKNGEYSASGNSKVGFSPYKAQNPLEISVDSLLKDLQTISLKNRPEKSAYKTTSKILDDLLDGKRENEITTAQYGRVKIEKRKYGYFILTNVSEKHPNGLVVNISQEAKDTWAAESDPRKLLNFIEPFDFGQFVNNLKKTGNDEDDQEIPGIAVSVRNQEIEQSPISVIREKIQKIRRKVFPKERP